MIRIGRIEKALTIKRKTRNRKTKGYEITVRTLRSI